MGNIWNLTKGMQNVRTENKYIDKMAGNKNADQKTVENKSQEGYGKNWSYDRFSISNREEQLKKMGLGKDDNETGTVEYKGREECETCKKRKYQDGSNEMVSFKSAAHISPQAAGVVVRAHENEHVANAYDKAAENDGEVVNASVAIHTAICPECGRVYVSGGTTTTSIRYNSDRYAKNTRALDAAIVPGKEMDFMV